MRPKSFAPLRDSFSATRAHTDPTPQPSAEGGCQKRPEGKTRDLRPLLQLKAEGITEASLANAPLANVSEPRGPLDRGVAMLFENMNAFYGYKNLFQFKKKFAPIWEGRYLIYPKGAELPRVAYALVGVHTSGGLWQLLFRR